MFYSHEILTDRKHGVATVWLVATLGSKSALKKITRKAILDVNVPRACGTITEPAAPMALRLQGSLLYGVSRVFSQQCGYMLNDIQNLHNKMRCVALLVKEIETDPDVANTRPEQLNISEDPAFDLELDMGLDLSTFNFGDTNSSSISFHTPTLNYDRDIEVEEPSLKDSFREQTDENADLDFVFDNDNDLYANVDMESDKLHTLESDAKIEQGIVQHPDFEISEDGSLRMLTSNMHPNISITTTGFEQEATDGNSGDSAISAQIRADHEAGLNENHEVVKDHFVDIEELEDPILPFVEPFSLASVASHNDVPEHIEAPGLPSSEAVEGTTFSAEAPHRRAPRTKIVECDHPTELGNRNLSEWNNDYIANMEISREAIKTHVSLAQARRNATFWVLEQGIGGVLLNYGSDVVSHPFAEFSGQVLLDTLTGRRNPHSSKKRFYPDTQEVLENSGRRVRARTEDEEVGRGNKHLELDADRDNVVIGEDDIPESEVGRQGLPSLKDHSSDMPWNLSSRQGPQFPYENIPFAASSSFGRLSSAEFGPPSVIRQRGQRMTSASPLLGKGRPSSWLGSIEVLERSDTMEDEEMGFTNLDAELAGDFDEAFELYGPAAAVNTQEATSSQWLAMTLENEAKNFLSFVITAIQEKVHRSDEVPTRLQDTSTTFRDLLDPKANSNIVAAQGFLHTLALASKSLILVEQSEAYGDITLKVAASAGYSLSREGRPNVEEGDETEEL